MYGIFHKFMENSTKSMNIGHCQPKHHCNPCNSSPTTLVSIIISKNIMLSTQNKLWSKNHTLPSCRVARIQLPGGLARGRESPGEPAQGLFFASKIRCSLTKNTLTFFSDKIFAWIFFLLESCGPVASISDKTNNFGAQSKNLEPQTCPTGKKRSTLSRLNSTRK